MSKIILRRRTVEWKNNDLNPFSHTAGSGVRGAERQEAPPRPVSGSIGAVRLFQRKDAF